MSEIIHCDRVTLSYDGHLAVSDVSFSISSGDYLCILGSNGSGKSTLMKGILGLEPLRSGSIDFHNLEQKEIGYLPQQTVIQKDFPATVYEIVLSGNLNSLGNRPFFGKSFKAKTQKNIELLGIGEIKNKSYRDLSGGQQQRVLLARALCATQKILLLDEPTAGLDPSASSDLYSIIKDLNQNFGITIVLISHDIPHAVKYASHILHLNTKLEFFGETSDYKKTTFYDSFIRGEKNI